MPKSTVRVLEFRVGEEKKHSVRYEENGSAQPVLKTLYVAKHFLGHPYPQRLRVTVEA